MQGNYCGHGIFSARSGLLFIYTISWTTAYIIDNNEHAYNLRNRYDTSRQEIILKISLMNKKSVNSVSINFQAT